LSPDSSPSRWKLLFLGTLALGSLIVAFFWKPIPQPPAYHQLADARPFLGIPNFLNVVSNLPFLVAGLCGLYNVLRRRNEEFLAAWVRGPWIVLTSSLFLTGLGSSYYHWNPTDATLFWDRLPMAVGFASVLGIMIIERIDLGLGRWLWAPLVLAAVGSLLYWRLGGDLRFYVLLQGWALALVPLILILFPGKYTRGHAWFVVLACYGLAKFFELGDYMTWRLGGVVSGHTLKHLCAGLAAGFIARHVRTRVRLDSVAGTAPPAA